MHGEGLGDATIHLSISALSTRPMRIEEERQARVMVMVGESMVLHVLPQLGCVVMRKHLQEYDTYHLCIPDQCESKYHCILVHF